ncbi:MAG: hypothetical protein RL248_1102, partial [Pseudomonadota bacterium]
MNKLTQSPVQDYIADLPLTAQQQEALRNVLPEDVLLDSTSDAMQRLHQQLAEIMPDGVIATEKDSALVSVSARVQAAWPDALVGKRLLARDDEGRTVIHATPPIKRTSMAPQPWRTNPVGRFWDSILGRTLVSRAQTREQTLAEKKWRSVGSLRRYILLVLIILQTTIATSYMKT